MIGIAFAGKQLRKRIDDNAAHAGAASGERHDLDRHGETHNAFGKFGANADSVRQHEIALELLELR